MSSNSIVNKTIPNKSKNKEIIVNNMTVIIDENKLNSSIKVSPKKSKKQSNNKINAKKYTNEEIKYNATKAIEQIEETKCIADEEANCVAEEEAKRVAEEEAKRVAEEEVLCESDKTEISNLVNSLIDNQQKPSTISRSSRLLLARKR